MVSIRLLSFDRFCLRSILGMPSLFYQLRIASNHEAFTIDTLSMLLGVTFRSFEVVPSLKELNASINLS